MTPIGHLSAGYLLHRVGGFPLGLVLFAAIFPDLFDKPLRYLLGIQPFGRSYMHGVVGLAAASLLAWILAGRRTALAWALGHGSHILLDSFSFVPYFYPVFFYEFPQDAPMLSLNPPSLVSEAVLILVVVWVFIRHRPAAETSGGTRNEVSRRKEAP